MKHLVAVGFAFIAAVAWGEPVSGDLDVQWNEGAPDCVATATVLLVIGGSVWGVRRLLRQRRQHAQR